MLRSCQTLALNLLLFAAVVTGSLWLIGRTGTAIRGRTTARLRALPLGSVLLARRKCAGLSGENT